jgi:hypothetical protein
MLFKKKVRSLGEKCVSSFAAKASVERSGLGITLMFIWDGLLAIPPSLKCPPQHLGLLMSVILSSLLSS